MPYSHSHRVAWPRPKAGDSVLLTFDFRSSRRGGRHHVRLEYQLPIRSENGTTSRSYSVIPLKVTHYLSRSRLNTTPPSPTPPPARPPARPVGLFAQATICFLVPVYFQVNDCRCWIAISIFYPPTHVHRHTWETYTRGDTSADVYPVQHCCTYTRTRVCILSVCLTHPRNVWNNCCCQFIQFTCTDSGDFLSHATWFSLSILCCVCLYLLKCNLNTLSYYLFHLENRYLNIAHGVFR